MKKFLTILTALLGMWLCASCALLVFAKGENVKASATTIQLEAKHYGILRVLSDTTVLAPPTGQAVLDGLAIAGDRIQILGLRGAGKDASSYGILVTDPAPLVVATYQIWLGRVSRSDIIIDRVAVVGWGTQDNPQGEMGLYNCSQPNAGYSYRIRIANNYFTNQQCHLRFERWVDSVIEGNYFYSNWSLPAAHGAPAAEGGSKNLRVVGNIWENGRGTCCFTMAKGGNAGYVSDRAYIAGNVVIGGSWGNGGLPGCGKLDRINNTIVENNTFVNVVGGGQGGVCFFGIGTGNVARRNLIWHTSSPGIRALPGGSVVREYNWFGQPSGYYYTKPEIGATDVVDPDPEVDPFIDSVGGDFHLRAPLILGEGTLDVGAYDYISLIRHLTLNVIFKVLGGQSVYYSLVPHPDSPLEDGTWEGTLEGILERKAIK